MHFFLVHVFIVEGLGTNRIRVSSFHIVLKVKEALRIAVHRLLVARHLRYHPLRSTTRGRVRRRHHRATRHPLRPTTPTRGGCALTASRPTSLIRRRRPSLPSSQLLSKLLQKLSRRHRASRRPPSQVRVFFFSAFLLIFDALLARFAIFTLAIFKHIPNLAFRATPPLAYICHSSLQPRNIYLLLSNFCQQYLHIVLCFLLC